MMEFESIDELHMHFSRELASWHITREEYDGIDEMLKAVEEDVSKRIEEAEAFAKRVQEAVENKEDVTLFGVDYMRLPKDENGEFIHLGDFMESADEEPFYVTGIGKYVLFYGGDDEPCEWTSIDNKVHHKPTIEEILSEFACKIRYCCDKGAVIAEYAKKLRLADDDTEHMRSK